MSSAERYESLPQAKRDRIQAGVEAIAGTWVVRNMDTGSAAWYDLVEAVLDAVDALSDPATSVRA